MQDFYILIQTFLHGGFDVLHHLHLTAETGTVTRGPQSHITTAQHTKTDAFASPF